MRNILMGLLFLLSVNVVFASQHKAAIPSLKNLRPMNGIDPQKYDRFWDRWKLLSVRFREDNREQRFIYVNKIGYQAIKKNVRKFPDGTVFGKVAFRTRPDRSFPNSLEPYDFSRLQLMVKDQKRFSKSDGWSYWLYLDQDKLSKTKDSERLQACHACHTLVKKQDFVFTTPTFLQHKRMTGETFRKHFLSEKKLNLTSLESSIQKFLINTQQPIFIARMPMFSGSQYESIGPLSKYAYPGKTFLLIDPKSGKFLLAESQKSTKKCKKRVRILLHKFKKDLKSKTKSIIKVGMMCDGKNKWLREEDLPSGVQKQMPL